MLRGDARQEQRWPPWEEQLPQFLTGVRTNKAAEPSPLLPGAVYLNRRQVRRSLLRAAAVEAVSDGFGRAALGRPPSRPRLLRLGPDPAAAAVGSAGGGRGRVLLYKPRP